MKPVIVHISNDYPDPLQPDKTKAIANLVEATPEFRHVVYSLNRVNGWSGMVDIPFGEDRTAVAYSALPKGLLWERRLDDVARWIAADLKKKKIVPGLIEAHKLTVEGLIGQHLAEVFSCSLVCDIQGGTDLRVLKGKVNLHKRYRQIADRSSLIFPYAPWIIELFHKTIGLDRNKCRYLPVLPGFDGLTPSRAENRKKIVTLVRFGDWKNKNLAGIAEAICTLSRKHPELTLDIYGGGVADSLLQIQKSIRGCGVADKIFFKGPVANENLPGLLNRYTALVMPSFSESYGLVYAEALFNGVPVLYSKNRGIDGYFEDRKIGYACDPRSADDIAAGIDHLLTQETSLKSGIAEMQASGAFDSIRRAGIIDTYRSGLSTALRANA
jgi:glycosyltransferase involved in cell wall biosynthesis